ncbi:LacI family DNA-binding transcriptional regulator [[Empedobacter] haloabium]|uniref:LacI family DNA-binding transcriptional regulator n=1 Tax=[Empedobacter] haloabium TaxID=592317 RepID=A0ABZ1UFT0_9BURK
MPARRPTMTDIAKQAGVSQSTVSLVLNDVRGTKVSKATRELVLAIAREIGYPQVRHPRSGAAPQRNLILYLTDELATSPHAMQTIDGASNLAWEQDCIVSVFATRSDPAREAAILAQMLANPALLGVIYATIFTRRASVPAALGATQVPVVLLNCHARDHGYPSVVPAEVLGGYAATMHLVEAGHRRIGLINGEPWLEAAAERHKGYRQALTTADIPYDPALVREGDWQVGSGFAHALALLRLPEPPTALFCANDLMAIGAIDAARQLELDIPGRLSIVGYDDQDMARYVHPPLTTVLLPNYEMGRWAAETLIGQARAGLPALRQQIKMECPLVVRESVAGPATGP